MSVEKPFTKENLDNCLKELAKEFRKMNGNRVPAEIVLIGGASILINYGFREMTYDMDAIIRSSGAMKDAINIVGDRLGLPVGWLNTDFLNTDSYTPRLIEYSKYYKTFSNILQIRTVSAEYLVAMKLMAGRQMQEELNVISRSFPAIPKVVADGIYGENTKKAVEMLADKLRAKGCPKVVVHDLARTDMAEAVEDAFRYNKLVLATTTYNAGIFPFMRDFIEHLTERNYQNRTVALIEN